MDTKDAVVAAALLNSAVAHANNMAASEIRAARAKGENEVAALQHETRMEEMRGSMKQDSFNRDNINDLERKNRALSIKMEKMEAEMNEMRTMMKEWVSSQRGLLALAKELRKEAESCPNKEHHKLASEKASQDVAIEAAAVAYDDIQQNGIPQGIPAFTPKWAGKK